MLLLLPFYFYPFFFLFLFLYLSIMLLLNHYEYIFKWLRICMPIYIYLCDGHTSDQHSRRTGEVNLLTIVVNILCPIVEMKVVLYFHLTTLKYPATVFMNFTELAYNCGNCFCCITQFVIDLIQMTLPIRLNCMEENEQTSKRVGSLLIRLLYIYI